MTRTLAGNALIDMYAKCGSIRDACSEFKILRERDQVVMDYYDRRIFCAWAMRGSSKSF